MLNGDDDQSWPEALKTFYNDDGVMSALGGLVWYLSSVRFSNLQGALRILLTKSPCSSKSTESSCLRVTSMVRINLLSKQYPALTPDLVYDPVRHSTSLVLDGQTIINLEIFENNYDGTDTGSLYKLLMRCFTPFGKRLFKRWLCHPLRHADIINQRLDAVEDLDNIRGVQGMFGI